MPHHAVWIRQLLALGVPPPAELDEDTLMLRLTAIFFIWMVSTACALEDGDSDHDAECYALMAQERAAELRYLTKTNVRTIVPADGRAQYNPDQR
jgi:hypothetical protein